MDSNRALHDFLAMNYIHMTERFENIPFHKEYVTWQAADFGYDDHKLYNLSIHRRGFELVCPVSKKYTAILPATRCN